MKSSLCFAGVFVLATAGLANTTYRITDLGDLPYGSDRSRGYGLSSDGQVAGYSSWGGSNYERAFRWTESGGMEHLGSLPGGNTSYAYGVNSSGTVVGLGQSSAGQRAFKWDSTNGMAELPGLSGGFGYEARAIADSGAIAGSAADSSDYRAVFWDPSGGIHDLGFLAGTQRGFAQSLNDVGQVVGYCLYPTTAFIWDAANGMSFIYGPPTNNVDSVAYDINNSGVVVGYVADYSLRKAFMWTRSGGITWIGNLGGANAESYGFSVNDSGTIVGQSDSDFDRRAFIWTASSGIQDLNTLVDPSTPGWHLNAARGINNSGQIVGYGSINGVTHGFLATPVPEPASSLVLLVGIFSCLSKRRKSSC